jgi:hypothetical protein
MHNVLIPLPLKNFTYVKSNAGLAFINQAEGLNSENNSCSTKQQII